MNKPSVLIAQYYDGYVSLLSAGIGAIEFAPVAVNQIMAESMREDADVRNGVSDQYFVCVPVDASFKVFECVESKKRFSFKNVNGILCPIPNAELANA